MNASKDTFISSTTHTESVGFAAMIAVLDFYSGHDVAQDLAHRGSAIRTILLETADKYDLNISTKGLNQLWSWSFDFDASLNRQLQTIVTESMLSSSILFSNRFYATLGIDSDHDDIFRRAISRAFKKISMIINTNEDPKEHIQFGLNRLGIY
jgi:glutamate-1-semialdehyde aminotransferase